jgi:carboxylesterase type B
MYRLIYCCIATLFFSSDCLYAGPKRKLSEIVSSQDHVETQRSDSPKTAAIIALTHRLVSIEERCNFMQADMDRITTENKSLIEQVKKLENKAIYLKSLLKDNDKKAEETHLVAQTAQAQVSHMAGNLHKVADMFEATLRKRGQASSFEYDRSQVLASNRPLSPVQDFHARVMSLSPRQEPSSKNSTSSDDLHLWAEVARSQSPLSNNLCTDFDGY